MNNGFLANLINIFNTRMGDILHALGEHMLITAAAVIFGIIIAVPLGIAMARTKSGLLRTTVFTAANVLQTIPSLALLAILIPLLGIGTKPAIFALFLYSLMPLMQNTYSGFRAVNANVVEAARGMGFSAKQLLLQIQLPLAAPYIMTGIRVTTVYIVSWATLAAMIGAGGLGRLIFSGMSVNKKELTVAGSIVAVVLALAVDLILGRLERRITSKAGGAETSAQNKGVEA